MKKHRLLGQVFAAAVILSLLVSWLPVVSRLVDAENWQLVDLLRLEKEFKGHPKRVNQQFVPSD